MFYYPWHMLVFIAGAHPFFVATAILTALVTVVAAFLWVAHTSFSLENGEMYMSHTCMYTFH